MTAEHKPDIVIMDISMPVLNGVEATKQIKSSSPLTAVLILTVHTDVETIFSILQAGASGYLVKSIFGPEVVHTIRAVMDGDMVLSAEVSQEVLKYALQHGTKPVKPLPPERISAKGHGGPLAGGQGSVEQGDRVQARDSGGDGQELFRRRLPEAERPLAHGGHLRRASSQGS